MDIQRRTLIAGLGGLAVAAPLLAACAKESEKAEKPTATPTSKSPIAPPVTGEPGTLLNQEPIDTGIKGAKAWRIRYVSKDVNGVTTESSGLVIAPAGRGTNRPILTWCHGTTGLGDAACPSAQPDPARELITYFEPQATQQIDYGVPGLQGWIDDGWVVVATDYQGLGTPGMHQYTVNITNARDGIYAAHAARKLETDAGTAVGCAGWSQGGGAAAAIAELDAADYGDLKLIGTVCMSPGVTKVGLEIPSPMTTALTGAKVAPDSHLVMLLAGVQAANPTKLQLAEAFSPLGVDIINTAWNIQPVHHLNDTIARLFRLKGAVLNPTPPNFPAWKEAIIASSAAQKKPVAPVLVCIDTFDGGTVIPVAWQTGYVDAVQKLGGNVETLQYEHDDHFSLPQSCVGDARAWLNKLKG
ncbi:MAG TPA: lipase family protein [Mycobacterium sp.]|mgnify:CR=1 FL=1|uniref:lipase family protein n=1 Tax=Mycolicibacterium sp. TaxID=2320850 RepID=UPI0025E5854A|nr:lipase family protein [Mycolicibacterium sp.]HPX36367.1 lipase family protein [Mycobacterium sp.]HQC76650.1 lipase family protein [Mycobacterium sp.]